MDPQSPIRAPDANRASSPSPEKLVDEPVLWHGRAITLLQNTTCCLYDLFLICIESLLNFLKSLRELARDKPLTLLEKHYGAGIYRDGHFTCYMNATIQALRFIPEFPPLPEKPKLPVGATKDDIATCLKIEKELNEKQEVRNRLDALRKALKERRLQSYEIRNFLQFLIGRGFHINPAQQQDVHEFFVFLLDQIGAPNFKFKMQVFHQFKLPINMLDKTENIGNNISLGMESAPENTPLQDLIVQNEVTTEEIEKQKLQKHYISLKPQERKQEGFGDGVDAEKTLGALPDTLDVHTLKSVQLAEPAPEFLPILLKRFTFDKKSQNLTKKKQSILPSPEIEFPVMGQGNSTKTARYKLDAILIHSGSSMQFGHYYTYVPKKDGYLVFDDDTVTFKKTDELFQDTCKNGYLFFYRLKGVVQKDEGKAQAAHVK